jgi:hypothetical protein
MSNALPIVQAEQLDDDERHGDFAVEHARPGFEASIPITAAIDQTPGPLEGLDPEHPRPERWARVKALLTGSRAAQRGSRRHPT